MESSDPALMLARFQFAFTISFHIVLAALSIGLANYLMVLEALWLWRKRQVYMDLYKWAPHRDWSWSSSSAPTGAHWPAGQGACSGR
jgi:hypothetical protein